MLNLNGSVSRQQFDTNTEPVNIVRVECRQNTEHGTFQSDKVFMTDDGVEHRPNEFQYDYKGCFCKNESDLVLWIYQINNVL